MKNLPAFILTCLLTVQIAGKCGPVVRYRDVVFTQIKIDNIKYETVDGHPLLMDVYQPVGDTSALRPLVILAHGGSFMHGSRGGEKTEKIPVMCRELASRGYVAVSIDYRLANLFQMASRKSAYKEIVKSVADGSASIAWFLNDIANGNIYRINKNRIFFGGNSAGAILAEQLAFINNTTACRPVLRKITDRYMNSANSLPPNTLHGVISLAGAVLDTNIIGPSGMAFLQIQGDADHVVPYGYARALGGLAPFKLAGLGGSRPRYTSQHLNVTAYIFKNAGHTPWDNNKEAFHVMMQQMLDFLQKEMR